MRPLGVVELQGAGQRFQNAFGNPAEVPALEPGVVGDADSGEDRDLLPAQARNTPGAVGRQTNLVGRELGSPGGQELPDLALGVHGISVTPPCLALGDPASTPINKDSHPAADACFLGRIPKATHLQNGARSP